MTDPADLRIGDAERADAAAELDEHYARGRIDTDEHAERLDRIWAARTRRELAPVFADLPGHRPLAPYAAPGARPTRGRRRGPWGIPLGVAVVLAVLLVVTVVTHLPLVLIILGVWFLASRNRCAPRSRRPHWS